MALLCEERQLRLEVNKLTLKSTTTGASTSKIRVRDAGRDSGNKFFVPIVLDIFVPFRGTRKRNENISFRFLDIQK